MIASTAAVAARLNDARLTTHDQSWPQDRVRVMNLLSDYGHEADVKVADLIDVVARADSAPELRDALRVVVARLF